MSEIISFESPDGSERIEFSFDESGPTDEYGLSNAGLSSKELKESVSKALSSIKTMGESVLQQIGSLAKKPSETHIEFGIQVEKKGSVIVLEGSAKAHLNVKLIWKEKD
ncbi:MAG: CU044_2847 family protein [Verrucomicrobiota bacterium]